MNSRTDQLLLRLAAIAVLVAAIGLAGCGRKAGLDPPPAAALSEPPEGAQPQGSPIQPQSGSMFGPDGKPVAPKTGEKKWIFLDWLID